LAAKLDEVARKSAKGTIAQLLLGLLLVVVLFPLLAIALTISAAVDALLRYGRAIGRLFSLLGVVA